MVEPALSLGSPQSLARSLSVRQAWPARLRSLCGCRCVASAAAATIVARRANDDRDFFLSACASRRRRCDRGVLVGRSLKCEIVVAGKNRFVETRKAVFVIVLLLRCLQFVVL